MWVKRVVPGLLAVLGLIALVVAWGVVRAKMEDGDALTITDPKRPYGDMTFFEIDMATILGITADGPPSAEQLGERDFSPAQLQHFAELHEQMEPVLQVFLLHARLAPGHFVRTPRGYGRWSRA